MIRVYIAGPYSADNIMDVLMNIRTGQEVAALLMSKGYAVYCPFLDYQLALISGGEGLTKEDFQRNSLAWVDASHALFILPNWEDSDGTGREIARAKQIGVPRFFTVEQLDAWAETVERTLN